MMPLTVSLLLTGCVIKQPQGLLFCEVAHPIYIGKEDSLTVETKRQILSHDIVGQRICQWGGRNQSS